MGAATSVSPGLPHMSSTDQQPSFSSSGGKQPTADSLQSTAMAEVDAAIEKRLTLELPKKLVLPPLRQPTKKTPQEAAPPEADDVRVPPKETPSDSAAAPTHPAREPSKEAVGEPSEAAKAPSRQGSKKAEEPVDEAPARVPSKAAVVEAEAGEGAAAVPPAREPSKEPVGEPSEVTKAPSRQGSKKGDEHVEETPARGVSNEMTSAPDDILGEEATPLMGVGEVGATTDDATFVPLSQASFPPFKKHVGLLRKASKSGSPSAPSRSGSSHVGSESGATHHSPVRKPRGLLRKASSGGGSKEDVTGTQGPPAHSASKDVPRAEPSTHEPTLSKPGSKDGGIGEKEAPPAEVLPATTTDTAGDDVAPATAAPRKGPPPPPPRRASKKPEEGTADALEGRKPVIPEHGDSGSLLNRVAKKKLPPPPPRKMARRESTDASSEVGAPAAAGGANSVFVPPLHIGNILPPLKKVAANSPAGGKASDDDGVRPAEPKQLVAKPLMPLKKLPLPLKKGVGLPPKMGADIPVQPGSSSSENSAGIPEVILETQTSPLSKKKAVGLPLKTKGLLVTKAKSGIAKTPGNDSGEAKDFMEDPNSLRDENSLLRHAGGETGSPQLGSQTPERSPLDSPILGNE
eukprot:GHVU01143340.1.p1 GENE.GHVU01143340.1~~GHVU01143340.1.p1  ORF type:complete len:742 (-),score=124.36 GHVU01143340.1:154-2046(-)